MNCTIRFISRFEIGLAETNHEIVETCVQFDTLLQSAHTMRSIYFEQQIYLA